jgi:hypothetical protein
MTHCIIKSKFEKDISKILNNKTIEKLLIMSCSPECLEFMEQCYEEQELEKKAMDFFDENPYAMTAVVIANMREKIQKATTVIEVKNILQDMEDIYLDIKKDDRYMKLMTKVITDATGAPIIKLIDYIFTDDDCRQVMLMLSNPFPIDNTIDIIEKWCLSKNYISDFFMATRRPECYNLIWTILRMSAVFEDCRKNGTEPSDEIIKQYKLAIITDILPMIITSNYVQIFNQGQIPKEKVKEVYESVESLLKDYHQLLSSFEEIDLSDGSYLDVCNEIKKKHTEFKSFLKCFDLEDNLWICGKILYDFNNGSTNRIDYS